MSHKLTNSHLHLWFCTTDHNFSSSEMLAKSVIMFKKTKSSSCIYPTWPLFCSFVQIWPTGWPILLAAKLEISLLVLHQPHHHLPPLPREIPKSQIVFHQGDHCYIYRIYLMMTNILEEIVFTAAIKFQIRAAHSCCPSLPLCMLGRDQFAHAHVIDPDPGKQALST